LIDDFLKLMDWHVALSGHPSHHSVIVAVVLEHDRLKENVSQIGVLIIVHVLDNASRSICGEVG